MSNAHRMIQQFFTGLGSGALPADLLTDDFSAYTSTSGEMDGARYLGAAPLLAAIFDGGITYESIAIMEGEGRIAVEARGSGTFKDGAAYRNDYVFLFYFKGDKISRVAEHFNPKPVTEHIAPRIQALIAQMQKGS